MLCSKAEFPVDLDSNDVILRLTTEFGFECVRSKTQASTLNSATTARVGQIRWLRKTSVSRWRKIKNPATELKQKKSG